MQVKLRHFSRHRCVIVKPKHGTNIAFLLIVIINDCSQLPFRDLKLLLLLGRVLNSGSLFQSNIDNSFLPVAGFSKDG